MVEGVFFLVQGSRSAEPPARALEVAERRGDHEVRRLAQLLLERVNRRDAPPRDRGYPAHLGSVAKECGDRLRRWAAPPRGQAARMLQKYLPKQPLSETAASTGWRRPAV